MREEENYKKNNPQIMYVPFKLPLFLFQMGLPGGGGEYDVQEGFGWSNGVAMQFLAK